MPSAFRKFHTDTTIGPKAPPRRRIRNQLREILDLAGHPAEPGMETLQITNFQTDFGLEPDGIVRPGGPTENMMNAVAIAAGKGGPAFVEDLKPAIRALARQGLTWSADPRDPDALGMWRDRQGRRVEPDRAGEMIPVDETGKGAPSGAAGLLAERMVGKTGRDRIMMAKSQSARHGVPNPFEIGDIDSFDAEPNATSGTFRRGADRVMEGVDRLRREQAEKAPDSGRRPPHRDIEKIEWERNSFTGSKPLTEGKQIGMKVHDAIRIDLETVAIGGDGARLAVDWLPLDARGNVIPEFRRPDHRREVIGGHTLLLLGASRVLLSPRPNKHGFRVELSYPRQPPVHGNTAGVKVHIFAPVGELKSVEPQRKIVRR